MADLLHQADHAGIARAVMLRAIKERAATKDDASASDISEALENLDDLCAQGAWFELVRRAFWLAERALRGNVGTTADRPGVPTSVALARTEGGDA